MMSEFLTIWLRHTPILLISCGAGFGIGKAFGPGRIFGPDAGAYLRWLSKIAEQKMWNKIGLGTALGLFIAALLGKALSERDNYAEASKAYRERDLLIRILQEFLDNKVHYKNRGDRTIWLTPDWVPDGIPAIGIHYAANMQYLKEIQEIFSKQDWHGQRKMRMNAFEAKWGITEDRLFDIFEIRNDSQEQKFFNFMGEWEVWMTDRIFVFKPGDPDEE